MARALNDASHVRRTGGAALVALVLVGVFAIDGSSAHAQATDPSAAPSDSQVECSVAIECAAWTDLVELHAALRGEALHGAALALDGCEDGRARLVARWSDGARERRGDLTDVPHRARASTVASRGRDRARRSTTGTSTMSRKEDALLSGSSSTLRASAPRCRGNGWGAG